jgi:hypothetical protein
MKHILLFTAVALLFSIAACKKESIPEPYKNIYVGTYSGVYSQANNGVDSDGVFKSDTSFTYQLEIEDGGDYTVSIVKGPVSVPAIPIDSTGHFTFVDFNRTIDGYFVNDSLYLTSKALRGDFDYPQWFLIQQLDFAGKKQ